MAKKTAIQREDGSLLFFDAVTRRVETNTARLTKHPVEQGFTISDHIMLENLRLSVEGSISSANNSVLDRAAGALPSSVSGFLGTSLSDPDEARKTLQTIFESKEAITLIAPEQTYPIDDLKNKLFITSLVFEKGAPTKGYLGFRIQLEQVRTVTSATSVVPAETVDADVQKAAQKEVKSGTKVTTEKVEESQLNDLISRNVKRILGQDGD